MNNTEIKTIFKNYLVLLECHNEQKRHISDYFRKKGIRTLEYPFFNGDYSFMIMPNSITGNDEPLFFGTKFIIERKSGNIATGGGFQEIKGNLTVTENHKCFKAEFERLANVDNVYLLIENAYSIDDIKKVRQYKLSTSVFIKIFHSFMKKRNQERNELGKKDIEIVYSHIYESGEKVMLLIKSYLESL